MLLAPVYIQLLVTMGVSDDIWELTIGLEKGNFVCTSSSQLLWIEHFSSSAVIDDHLKCCTFQPEYAECFCGPTPWRKEYEAISSWKYLQNKVIDKLLRSCNNYIYCYNVYLSILLSQGLEKNSCYGGGILIVNTTTISWSDPYCPFLIYALRIFLVGQILPYTSRALSETKKIKKCNSTYVDTPSPRGWDRILKVGSHVPRT